MVAARAVGQGEALLAGADCLGFWRRSLAFRGGGVTFFNTEKMTA
jgi:hypothetical protein